MFLCHFASYARVGGSLSPPVVLSENENRQAVPRNAPRVICGNCEAPFVFKEYEETCAARSAWEKDIDILEATVKAAAAANEKAIVDRDKAYLEASKQLGNDGEGGGAVVDHAPDRVGLQLQSKVSIINTTCHSSITPRATMFGQKEENGTLSF